MLTRDEQKQLDTLRFLEQKAQEAAIVFDRFNRREDEAKYEEIKAKIAALPESVRLYAARENELKKFITAIESFILERASRFLPDVDDLVSTIMNLSSEGDLSQRQLDYVALQEAVAGIQNLKGMNRPLNNEVPVRASLAKLLSLKATHEEIEIAILLAADLDESRLQKVKYLTRLKSWATEYLDERQKLMESQPTKGLASLWTKTPDPLLEAEDLVHATREWQALIPQYREQHDELGNLFSSKDALERLIAKRLRIMSQIAVLHRLETQDETIDTALFDAQNAWNGKQKKK